MKAAMLASEPLQEFSLRLGSQLCVWTIRVALEQNHWNITGAAQSLGIARNTLHRKIKKYRLKEI
jgi:transcriptional regulator of acetoin/glycerol metabolism